MSDQFGPLLKRAQEGDQRSLARLLTLVEREGANVLRHKELLEPSNAAFRVGITGPPGAGKSTLVGHLIRLLKKRDLKIAVLAVDPSSPFSHGAILGDRIRYTEHSADDGIFIRSLGTRGSLGGLSAAAYLMLRVFDAVGFDVVLIETVGVGQTELEIMNVADKVVVVLVPESGDSVQAMKAGLLEIADLFVVNKADRPGAQSMAKELQFIADTAPAGRAPPKVMMTTATTGDGVSELSNELAFFAKEVGFAKRRASPGRLQNEARSLLRQAFERDISARIAKLSKPLDLLSVIAPKKTKPATKRAPKPVVRKKK